MKLKLVIHAYNISLYISCVSYSGWIISLIAMATIDLKWEKWKLKNRLI